MYSKENGLGVLGHSQEAGQAGRVGDGETAGR